MVEVKVMPRSYFHIVMRSYHTHIRARTRAFILRRIHKTINANCAHYSIVKLEISNV